MTRLRRARRKQIIARVVALIAGDAQSHGHNMNRHAKMVAILLLASAVPLAGPAFAQASLGGPTKQRQIGGPAKTPSLTPSQKVGTVTSPATTPCAACVKKSTKK
jgi:hypothetical protein